VKIAKVETFICDAGWRPWIFLKITTDEGLVGWSECTDSGGSPRGLMGVVADLSEILIGKDPMPTEKLYWEMYSRTRQSPGGIIAKAIGGIENALLDIKAKALGVPVYSLFGGPIRDKVLLYWSHCGTTRVRAARHANVKPIKTINDVVDLGAEVARRGFRALKTNILVLPQDDLSEPYVYMPGFAKSHGGPELNFDSSVEKSIHETLEAFNEGSMGQLELILDLNFNFKTDGYLRLGDLLEEFGLMWLEIDTYDPQALLEIKEALATPICSGENLYGARSFKPFFELHAMDFASIDVIWNGFAQSKKIAGMAEIYEMNVAPHNYYSHLATAIALQFCATVPNVKILEYDVDDVPWRDELVNHAPEIKDGHMLVSDRPGWGMDINEEVLKKHPWPKV